MNGSETISKEVKIGIQIQIQNQNISIKSQNVYAKYLFYFSLFVFYSKKWQMKRKSLKPLKIEKISMGKTFSFG